ncbi:hypothetical protein B0H11DRAFT_2233254 [Mycena galericulata]|nr:hypothetical protein B0H11DRAFT_2233254 [Mycena galericulata]
MALRRLLPKSSSQPESFILKPTTLDHQDSVASQALHRQYCVLTQDSIGGHWARNDAERGKLGKIPASQWILHPQARTGLKLNGLDDSENLQQ